MTSDPRSNAGQVSGSFALSQRKRWFAGLTWKGVALIALLSLLNALRRNVYELFRHAAR